MHGISNHVTFERALLSNPEVSKHLSKEDLDAALDPTTYVGLAAEIVDRVLADTRRQKWLM
jgi:adenylosuccinate lyase